MSQSKALKLQKRAEELGWSAKDLTSEGERWTLTVSRGAETLICWWDKGSMLECPIYRLGAYQNRPRNGAAALRLLAGQPDLTKAYKKTKPAIAKKLVSAAVIGNAAIETAVEASDEAEEVSIVRHELPFDINTDSDKKILRSLRGSRLVFLNSYTGAAEVAAIPRDRNWDLKDAFYLAEGSNGRAYVSFIDGTGCFRAVHLDAILQVG